MAYYMLTNMGYIDGIHVTIYIYVYMLTKMGYIDGMEHHIWQHHMDPSWDLGHGEFSRKRPCRGGHGDFQAFVMFEKF